MSQVFVQPASWRPDKEWKSFLPTEDSYQILLWRHHRPALDPQSSSPPFSARNALPELRNSCHQFPECCCVVASSPMQSQCWKPPLLFQCLSLVGDYGELLNFQTHPKQTIPIAGATSNEIGGTSYCTYRTQLDQGSSTPKRPCFVVWGTSNIACRSSSRQVPGTNQLFMYEPAKPRRDNLAQQPQTSQPAGIIIDATSRV